MTVTPGHVFARVQLLTAEIELVRLEMGRPLDGRPPLLFRGAAPREVFFEAAALFRKADRLCFERTGEEGALPHPPAVVEIEPMHVRGVVEAALMRVARVKHQLGIQEVSDSVDVVVGKEPSDVLNALFLCNRQINLLLEQPFSPNDVYQLMTLAVGYAARLVSHIGRKVPDLPAFERRKRPADVYARMWSVLGLLRTITTTSGLTMLEPGAQPYVDAHVAPSDVYDLSSLAISELVYLHSRVPALPPPTAAEFYEVGHKLPAHVFQRVGQLEATLRELVAAVQVQPDVLRT